MPLTVTVWYTNKLENPWQAPLCMNWPQAPFSLLLAASGNFEFGGSSTKLATRIGRISAFNTIQYWSVTKKRWRPLILDATALSFTDIDTARGDFSEEELTEGRTYYFQQTENTPAGKIIYQAKILELSKSKLRVQMFNLQPINRFSIEWIKTGEYQSYYEFTKLDGVRWHYFYALRSNAKSWMPIEKYESSYKNRAVALFRFIAGIKTDLQPPQFVN